MEGQKPIQYEPVATVHSTINIEEEVLLNFTPQCGRTMAIMNINLYVVLGA